MKRRDFFNFIIGTTAAWPLGAIAQTSANPIRGFPPVGSADDTANDAAGFRSGQKPPSRPPPDATYPPRVVYSDPAQIVAGKSYILTSGETAEVANAEFVNAAVPDMNGAGIRVGSRSTVIKNCHFRDSQEGILTNNNLTSLTLIDSRGERCGANNGQSHVFYIGSMNRFDAVKSVGLSPKDAGHIFKTRALENNFTGVISAMLDGHGSRCFDLTRGGMTVLDRVIMQMGPRADSAGPFIQWAPESPTEAKELRFKRVIAVNDGPRAYFTFCFGAAGIVIEELILIGSFVEPLFIDKGGHPTPVGLEKIVRFATRAEAGWPAYNGTEGSLTWPAAWGKRPGLWDEDVFFAKGPVTLDVNIPASTPLGTNVNLTWTAQNALGVVMTVNGKLSFEPSNGSRMIGPVNANTAIFMRAYNRNTSLDVSRTVQLIVPAHSRDFDLANLKPFWNEIPNTSLQGSGLFAGPWPTGVGTNAADKLAPWCGGAYADSRRQFLFGLHGGHAAGNDNSPYAFSLNTRKWTRLASPAPVTAAGPEYGGASRHTYGGVAWAEKAKRLYIGGRHALAGDGGNFAMNPETGAYEALEIDFMGSIGVYDPDRGLLFAPDVLGRVFTVYDPVSKAALWQKPVGGYEGFNQYTQAAYDTKRKQMVWFANGIGTVMNVSDLRSVTHRGFTQSPEALKRSGSFTRTYPLLPNPMPDSDVIKSDYGLAYHPGRDKFYAWNGGRDVLEVDPDTFTTRRIATPLDKPVPQPSSYQGIFGRWRYMPEFDAFLAIPTNPNANVCVYKPAA